MHDETHDHHNHHEHHHYHCFTTLRRLGDALEACCCASTECHTKEECGALIKCRDNVLAAIKDCTDCCAYCCDPKPHDHE